MKKTITLCLCLLAGLVIRAQGFVFQYQGQNLADGETVIFTAEEDWFGELSCETNSATNPNDGLMLKRLNSFATQASATMQITYNTLDAEILQWCMGGQCTPFNGQTSLTKTFKLADEVQVQFDATNIRNEGFLQATLRVTIGLESHSVNIIFANGDIDGIGCVQAESGQKPIFYDLSGRRVSGRTSSGIYIMAEGKHIRKVVIR